MIEEAKPNFMIMRCTATHADEEEDEEYAFYAEVLKNELLKISKNVTVN